MNDEKMYYLISARHTNHGDETVTFWRANSSGYCSRLDWAGKYTESQIKEYPCRYDNGWDTIAIPYEDIEKESVNMLLLESYACKLINDRKVEEK